MNTSRILRSLIVLLWVLSWPPIQASEAADEENPRFGGFDLREAPSAVQAQLARKTWPKEIPPYRISVTASPEEWATLIDETWGAGLGKKEKTQVFNRFWFTINRSYACFRGIEVDWIGLRDLYRPEVKAGVSRGRFAAIMSRLSLALMDAHSKASDKRVEWFSYSAPGVPLLNVGGWGLDTHFGAGLTPLPDKSLLVYKAIPAHPLGLEPGDIVLGYEGRPWSELYPEVLALGLPVAGLWGSSPSTYEHAWLMAAGLNWHLFDTIDVRKYGAEEVLHLPTSLLTGLNEEWFAPEAEPSSGLWVTEQLPVAGVPFPDFENGRLFSWGIIEGTAIGYIYGWGWYWAAEQEFYDAVQQLMFEHDTEGLIIDFRFNSGGDLSLSDLALELLFDETVRTIDFVERCDEADRLGLCAMGDSTSYLIPGSPESFYDKPIAVLTGPGAVGAGEQVALRLTYHPNAQVFGMSTNTAFNTQIPVKLRKQWDVHFAREDAFLLSASSFFPEFGYRLRIHNEEGLVPLLEDEPPARGTVIESGFLTHELFPVDHSVWLAPEDVIVGRDTVVEAAVQWIMTPRD